MNNNILIIVGTIVIVYFLLRNNKKPEKFSDNIDTSNNMETNTKSGNFLSKLVVGVTNILPNVLHNFIKNTAADVSNQLQNTSAPTQTSN